MKSKKSHKKRPNMYEKITNGIVEQLEKGVAPWIRPWNATERRSLPYNYTTGKDYRGVNIVWLWMCGSGFSSNGWMTFKQANDIGARVKKGSSGSPIVFYTTATKAVVSNYGMEEAINPDTGESYEVKSHYPMLKTFTVFNKEQIEGLPPEEEVEKNYENKPLPEVEDFIGATGADIRHDEDRAYYRPSADYINIPDLLYFDTPGSYYATTLHELGHWTGHKKRLDRKFSNYHTLEYAMEELVAEMTSAFLCAELAIPGKLQHAEYLGNWAKVLRENHRAIFQASSKATQAADFLKAFSIEASE